MIKLEFLNGPLSGETRLYRHTPVRIGRGTGCDLVLDLDTLVSRNHVMLSAREGQITLTDLGASNPTRVNGHPADKGPVLLESGDVLTLGETQLKFTWFEPPKPVHDRRRSFLEWVAMGTVGVILLSQLFFLVFMAPSWRSRVDVVVLRPTPTPVPDPLDVVDAPLIIDVPEMPDPAPEPEVRPDEGADAIPGPTPAPTPTPLPVPTPTPIPLTEDLTEEEQLERAREFIRDRRFLEADRLLNQIRDRYPDFLAAQVEYARLMGRQSRFQESMDAWEIVETLAEPGSAEAREAAIERPLMERRLRQLQRPVPTPVPPREEPERRMPAPPGGGPGNDRPAPSVSRPAPPPRPEVARNPSLLLQNIRVQRFADQSVADMREISFSLQHIFGTPAVPPGQVRVVARFYESDGQRIFPANVPAQTVTLHVNQEMARGNILRDLRVIYQVPLGSRGPNSGSFYGVVLRVFSGPRLDHELSLPASLLQYTE
jgi:hypothetical protein